MMPVKNCSRACNVFGKERSISTFVAFLWFTSGMNYITTFHANNYFCLDSGKINQKNGSMTEDVVFAEF